MCLWSIDKKTKQITEGWKVFKVEDNKLTGICYPFNFETNTWITDTNNKTLISYSSKELYKTGFHFYFLI